MPTREFSSGKIPPVPAEYGGRWVVWNADHSQIVADGESFLELWQLVRERKIENPTFEKVPRADVRFIGSRFR
jgi:hypothetical protein